MKVFWRNILLLGLMVLNSFCFCAEDTFDQHIMTQDDFSFVRYDAQNPKGVVLWVHGGPFEGPLNESLKIRENFFKDLVQAGYTVIAPAIPMKLSGEKDKIYKKILNKTAEWISTTFPGQNIFLLSHSLGGHWAGQTLLDKQAPLTTLIQKWVMISGTTHQGVRDLRSYMTDPSPILNKIRLREERYFWDESGPFTYSLQNAQNFNGIMEFGTWKLLLKENMEYRYQIGINYLYNPILDKALNEDLSLVYHVESLPTIPQLVVNPMYDMSVTVDTSAYYVNQNREKERKNVFFLSPEDGVHNWMINNMRESEHKTYTELFGDILSFLKAESYSDFEKRTEESLTRVQKYLEENPMLNYITCYQEFYLNQPIKFFQFQNQGTKKLSKSDLNAPVELRGRQEIEKTLQDLTKIMDLAFPVDLITQNNVDLCLKKFQDSSGPARGYFMRLKNSIANKLQEKK